MSAPTRLRPPEDPLLASAVRWKAVLASGNASPAEILEFESWQAESVRHAAASGLVGAKVAAVSDAIAGDDALSAIETRLAAGLPPHARPLVVASPERCEPLRAGRTVATAPGDVMDLVGDDGSYLRLQPSSTVAVAFDDGVWTIELLSGTIFVSRSSTAPGTMLVAVPAGVGGLLRIERGTEATIEIRESAVVCVVAAGRCVVTTDDDDLAIDAGFGTSFNRHLSRPEQADFDESFDWVEDRLIANARPLQAVIDRMRLLSPVPIFVEEALEDRTVDGEYRPSDTEASLRQIADYLKARLHCGRDGYVLGGPPAG